MSFFSSDHKRHEYFEHLKSSWAESVILIVFAVALLFMVLSSAVSYG
ncbi:MAG: hypothetical protein AAF304_03930 [Pseudomonadota bacterium]